MNNNSPLGRGALLAYGAPGAPTALVLLPLYLYLPAFYADNLGLGLANVGFMLLAARLWDMISDPMIGVMTDRISTAWGRRKPWILLGVPLVVVSIFPLFHPAEDVSIWELFFWTCLLYLGATMVILPHAAWGAELSGDYHERSRITGAREGFVVLGTIAAAALPAALSGGSLAAIEVIPYAMAVVLPITVAAALWLVPDGPARQRSQTKRSLRRGMEVLRANKPFQVLLATYFLNGIANGAPAALFLLFVNHVLGANEWQQGLLLLSYFMGGILSIPLWVLVSRRIGKHRAWMLAIGLACAAFLPVPFLSEGQLWEFWAISVVTGLCLGADLTLPPSMQADVIDLDTLKGGRNRSGLFFAFWGMATKLALALAVALTFPALEWFGFDPQAEQHEPQGLFALAALYAWLPVAAKLAATALISFYPITQEKQQRIRGLIARRQAAQ